MGSGRDKRKKAKGSAGAGHGQEKTAKKTDSNAEKAARRLQRKAEVHPASPEHRPSVCSCPAILLTCRRVPQGGEADIDALLAKFKLEDDANA